MSGLLTYSLEFRGEATADGDRLLLRACAPSWVHETRLENGGVVVRFDFDEGSDEATLEAHLTFKANGYFSAVATIDFGHGHRLHVETDDDGRVNGCADEHLRHGSAVLYVVAGTGQFDGATGQVTCNFVLSDTGDLTDNQLGMVFLGKEAVTRPA
jgi:hypothetical protein